MGSNGGTWVGYKVESRIPFPFRWRRRNIWIPVDDFVVFGVEKVDNFTIDVDCINPENGIFPSMDILNLSQQHRLAQMHGYQQRLPLSIRKGAIQCDQY